MQTALEFTLKNTTLHRLEVAFLAPQRAYLVGIAAAPEATAAGAVTAVPAGTPVAPPTGIGAAPEGTAEAALFGTTAGVLTSAFSSTEFEPVGRTPLR